MSTTPSRYTPSQIAELSSQTEHADCCSVPRVRFGVVYFAAFNRYRGKWHATQPIEIGKRGGVYRERNYYYPSYYGITV
jgi:pectate lyase